MVRLFKLLFTEALHRVQQQPQCLHLPKKNKVSTDDYNLCKLALRVERWTHKKMKLWKEWGVRSDRAWRNWWNTERLKQSLRPLEEQAVLIWAELPPHRSEHVCSRCTSISFCWQELQLIATKTSVVIFLNITHKSKGGGRSEPEKSR